MSILKVFDIEAHNWNQIYAIGIYDGQTMQQYVEQGSNKSNAAYMEWLLGNLQDDDVVYAHNGGRYDFMFILDYIKSSFNKVLKVRIINGSLVMLALKWNGKRIEFRDSYKILPASLARLTKDFDVPHKKLELDYSKGLSDERFKEYFENDLKGLYEVIAASGMTERLTTASNAMLIFKSQFYGKKMTRNKDRRDNFFRKAYYGGRTEIFRTRGKNLNYYDVNSLYPYVMLSNKFPLPEADNFSWTTELDDSHSGIYDATVESPDMHIPLLPYHSDKLIFPVGKWRATYTSAELVKAAALNYDVKVHGGYVFDKEEFIFKKYVEHYYKIKSESSGAKKEVSKLLLNSLYGKFGQRRERHGLEIYTGNKIPDVAVINGALMFVPMHRYDSYSQYLHSEIAALVTSYARLHLYSLMEKIGMDDIYYTDTDSIITSASVDTSNKLGDLKLEARLDEFVAVAPKVYAYKSKDKTVIRAKGLKLSDLKISDFYAAQRTGDFSKFHSSFERLSTLSESVRSRCGEYTQLRTMERQYKGIYNKRILNGYTTAPIVIDTKNL